MEALTWWPWNFGRCTRTTRKHMLGTVISGIAGLAGLLQSQRANRDANRLQSQALSVSDRQMELAEQYATNSEAYRKVMLDWVDDLDAQGAYSADAQIERGRQDIADYERRGMSAVNSSRRAGGYREGDSVVNEQEDRVAIEARRALAALRPALEQQARQEEMQARMALSPDLNLASLAQNAAGMQMQGRMMMSNAVRAQAGNPFAAVAALMPLLQPNNNGSGS